MKEILVVDDDQDYRELVRSLLRQEGMAVQCASDGGEGLALLKNRAFHLMITDFNMPGMSGLELARKSLGIAPDMPIIMSTGDISPEISRLATEAGISVVLSKPVHPHELLDVVRIGLRNAQMQD